MAIPVSKMDRQGAPAWNAILPHSARARGGRCRGGQCGKKRNQKFHAAMQYRNALTISARPYETKENL
jgi:hypothetical protein